MSVSSSGLSHTSGRLNTPVGVQLALLRAADADPPHDSPGIQNISASTRYHQSLADLLRPHVRNYETVNLLINWLSEFCDNSLAEARANARQTPGRTPMQQFNYSLTRFLANSPIDERIHPDIRQKMRTYNWEALWNAMFDQEDMIEYYQHNARSLSISRRRGSKSWLIMVAAHAYGADLVFSWEMKRYLEPIATAVASHPNFEFDLVLRTPDEHELEWYSAPMFPHWELAFQLLFSVREQMFPEDARQIWIVLMRQAMHVVDTYCKYWNQRENLTPAQFANCVGWTMLPFLNRQWNVELDSPFPPTDAPYINLHIRTILARLDHRNLHKELYRMVAYLTTTLGREALHRKMVQLVFNSLEDWARVTGNQNIIEGLRPNRWYWFPLQEADDWTNDVRQWMMLNSNRNWGPYYDRPLEVPPAILYYDLPDDLPDPAEFEDSDDENNNDANNAANNGVGPANVPEPGRIGRIINRVNRHNPFHTPTPNGPPPMLDVEMEAHGPLIDINEVAQPHNPLEEELCPICLEELPREDNGEKTAATAGPNNQRKEKMKANLAKVNPARIYKKHNAKKDAFKSQPFKWKKCDHVFHRACMQELLDQPYPKSGLVCCPCCRAEICVSRPSRIVRTGMARFPLLRRFSRN